jgi:hypothetical protein
MKRSQMSKYIQFFLENYSKEQGLFCRKNEQAFELLDLIEKYGMRPPRTSNPWLYGDDEWEKEDNECGAV